MSVRELFDLSGRTALVTGGSRGLEAVRVVGDLSRADEVKALADAAFDAAGARIDINIASVAGLKGSRPEHLRAIAYHTSKGGLVNFTRVTGQAIAVDGGASAV